MYGTPKGVVALSCVFTGRFHGIAYDHNIHIHVIRGNSRYPDSMPSYGNSKMTSHGCKTPQFCLNSPSALESMHSSS